MGFAGILRQSTAIDILIGPFVDKSNGDTEETALTINQSDVMLSKNGQAAAQKNDVTAAAHDADGFYNCEFDTTDTNTVGQLTLYVHVTGALAVRHDFQVIEEAVYDELFAASAAGFFAEVVETQGSITFKQALQIMIAALAGVTTSAGKVLKTPNGSATRITFTIDTANTERDTVTLDFS